MDKQVIALLIPIVALAIPLAGVIFYGLLRVARMRLEEARVNAGALDKGSEAEIATLRDEVGEARRERLLSQAREVDRLPGRPET
jgi:hypothetical protein